MTDRSEAVAALHYPRADGPVDSVLCACGGYQYDGWTFPDQGLPPDFWQHALRPEREEAGLREALKTALSTALHEDVDPACTGEPPFTDTQAQAALASEPARPSLDAAWARAEAALPEGWFGPELFTVAHDRWIARCFDTPLCTALEHAEADMPAAALVALAEKLEAHDA